LGCHEEELSVLIVDDSQIAKLNKQYLNRSGPTNVLAFPMNIIKSLEAIPKLLGDVVISVETAERESKIAGIVMEGRLDQLLIHGILHLFGYDHEPSKEKAFEMQQKSKEILNFLKTKQLD